MAELNEISDDPQPIERDAIIAEPNTFLTFDLGAQVFAVNVRNVREVLDMQRISAMPNAPHDLIGVIDVRGQGIGVIDLASRLGMQLNGGKNQRIIVFEMTTGEGVTPIGVIADRVLSVTEIPADQIEPPPSTLSSWDPGSVRGVARLQGTLAIILTLSQVFQTDELADDAFTFH